MGKLDVVEGYYNSNVQTVTDGIQVRYGQKEPSVTNTILEHRRGIANVAKGTTNENIDLESDLSVRKVNQIDRQQDQKDQDIALDA